MKIVLNYKNMIIIGGKVIDYNEKCEVCGKPVWEKDEEGRHLIKASSINGKFICVNCNV